MKRRHPYAFTRLVDRSLWLVVKHRSQVLSVKELPPKSDARAVLVRAMARSLDEGFTIDELPGVSPAYACVKDGERRVVSVTDVDPRLPVRFQHFNPSR